MRSKLVEAAFRADSDAQMRTRHRGARSVEHGTNCPGYRVAICLQAVGLAALLGLGGCSKEGTGGTETGAGTNTSRMVIAGNVNPAFSDEVDLLMRVRFGGTAALMADTNAAYLTNIAALPETAALGKRIVERFASLPERLVKRGARSGERGATGLASETNAQPSTPNPQPSTNPLEPLFADLLREGFLLELRGDSNGVSTMVLGTEVDSEVAARWNSAMAMAAKAWFAEEVANQGATNWSAGDGRIRFQRAGRWVVAELSTQAGAASRRSRYDATFRLLSSPGDGGNAGAALLQPDQPPPAPHGSALDLPNGCILSASVKSTLLPRQLQQSIYGNFERFDFQVCVNQGSLSIDGAVAYTSDLPQMAKPLIVPADLVTETPISFTAIRNPDGWMSRDNRLRALLPKPVAEPVFFWGGDGSPFQFFMALPFDQKEDFKTEYSPRLATTVTNAVGHLDIGSIVSDPDTGALAWHNVGFVAPRLSQANSGGHSYLVTELMPSSEMIKELPQLLVNHAEETAGLLYYDWEISRIRLECWLHLGQLMLFLSQHQQLGEATAGLKWILSAMGHIPMDTSTVTEIIQTSPRDLAFARRAPVGLTSVEVFWLANWLESETFPAANFLVPAPKPDVGTRSD